MHHQHAARVLFAHTESGKSQQDIYSPPLRWFSVYARVSYCVMLHPRHADVAPARALAAPRGALLE